MNVLKEPYLLCEVANVHGGDGSHMEAIISKFKSLPYKKKGIKFQVFKSDRIALPDFDWFGVYEQLYFDNSTWARFFELIDSAGDIWIDVFDTYGIEVLVENIRHVYGVKLQASVLENVEVFEALKGAGIAGKKLLLNVSGFDVDKISFFVEKFSTICGNIVIQIGYQSYPTEIKDTGLQKISLLKAAFPDLEICIADHADATTEFALKAPVYGVLLGCTYIEKHMCLSREGSKYDKYSALEPDELENLCATLNDLLAASSGMFISQAESDYLAKSIQIPVLRRDVKAGVLLAAEDFLYRRTAQNGLKASQIQSLQRNKMILSSPKERHRAIVEADYRPATIAAIVAGRMKSTRLPKKAILPIGGVASVERCLKQCTAIDGVNKVILATSDLESDDELKSYTLGGDISLWRGDPDDVIRRYLGACKYFGVDVVVRITADCPLVVPDIIEYLLDKHFESGADYTAAKECAVGSSGEVINTNALERVADYFGRARHSEYMTWYFQNNPDYFKVNLVDLPDNYIRNYRMTLDYAEDLQFFEEFYKKLKTKNNTLRASEIFDVLDNSPEVTAINSKLTLKYRTDQDLIGLLNKETRMS